jgi:hypothetical protein
VVPVAVEFGAVLVTFEVIKLDIEPAKLSSQYTCTIWNYLRPEACSPLPNMIVIKCKQKSRKTHY